MKKPSVLYFFAVVLFIAGIFFLLQGFDKKNNYVSPDSTQPSVNAYVGGDAYNYTINAGYFTGYAVISGASFISGFILLCSASIISCIQEKDGVIQTTKSTYV